MREFTVMLTARVTDDDNRKLETLAKVGNSTKSDILRILINAASGDNHQAMSELSRETANHERK